MKTKHLLLAIMFVTIGISNADAQIRHRTLSQRHRIHAGVTSGELTKGETKNLRGNQKEIRRDVKLAKADGAISAPERKILQNERNKQSREIYRKKHNNRDRT